MALLDLKEKKQWADFASKECISVDAAGCIDAKETQVPARTIAAACLSSPTYLRSKQGLQSKRLSTQVTTDTR